jgi:hypothetical protein
MKRHVLPKTAPFHTLFIKKKGKTQNGANLKALWVLFFPWTREAGEEEDFSSSVTTISLLKKTPTLPTPVARSFPRVGEEGGDVFLR